MKELKELKLNAQAMSDTDGAVMTDRYGNKLISRKVFAEDYAYYYNSTINESVYSHFDREYSVYFDTYYNRYDSDYAVNLDLPARIGKWEDTDPDYVASFWNSLKTYRALLISRTTPSSNWTSIPKVLKSFIGLSRMERSKLLAILKHNNARLDKEVIISFRDVYSYNNNYKLIGYVHGDSSVDNYTFAYDDYPY